VSPHPFSLSPEIRPQQSRGELVLQHGHDGIVGSLLAGTIVAIRLLRQEFQSGRLLGLALVRSYLDGHLVRSRGLSRLGR